MLLHNHTAANDMTVQNVLHDKTNTLRQDSLSADTIRILVERSAADIEMYKAVQRDFVLQQQQQWENLPADLLSDIAVASTTKR
jgi:hypothetical protein